MLGLLISEKLRIVNIHGHARRTAVHSFDLLFCVHQREHDGHERHGRIIKHSLAYRDPCTEIAS